MIGSRPHPPASGFLVREAAIVAVLTLAGAVVRLWDLKTLGLIHFDEGIYALAGLWSLSPSGLSALDPRVIAYAPPGFPYLVGISYLLFGVSDLAAILVSILLGTLTIPASAWLARRTFGAGAGVCAAALVAFSGFHIAFSRMALTDASFLLFWVLGLIAAQSFLERPGPGTAVLLGLGVGLAQLFKYNGWLIGAAVILAACASSFLDPQERSRARVQAVWGWGLLAAVVAALIYSPWFRFVEAHGGYRELLRHHRSYMGELASWLPHLRLQIEQADMLSGGPQWKAGALAAMFVCLCLFRPSRRIKEFFGVAAATSLFAAAVLVMPQWYSLVMPALWIGVKPKWTNGERVLGAAWYLLAILTPFYHPYARLGLPLYFMGLFVTGGMFGAPGAADLPRVENPAAAASPASRLDVPRLSLWCAHLLVVLICVCIMFPWTLRRPLAWTEQRPSPLSASDSLRNAVRQAAADLPPTIDGLRLLVRPPVTFYLGGRIHVQVEPNLDSLLVSQDPKRWALVDAVLLRQGGDIETAAEKLLRRWELVREYPTELNLPTLLDVDPGVARTGQTSAASAPLSLFRPRTIGKTP